MRRKLKGVKASIPQLQPRKHGWTRNHLIYLVNKICLDMLSQLGRESELQEPLAKAMAVADLSLELTTGCHSIFAKEFYEFSPGVKSLQSDIMNAIWSVKKVVSVLELRNLQLLIEPKATISTRCLRTAFANFLTEFLFECSDMDSVPKSLSQILDVVNRGSNGSMHGVLFKKKYIDEELDCILNTSALTKQIVLDLLPDDEFDKDFNDAYLEQLEESDESSNDEDDDDSHLQEDIQFRNETLSSIVSFCEAESIGDFAPFEFHHSTIMTEEKVSSSPITTNDRLNRSSVQLQPNNCGTVNSVCKVHSNACNQCQGESSENFSTFMAGKSNISSVVSSDRELDRANLFCKETEYMLINYNLCKNRYLAVQDACDKTSVFAYNLVGHMLEEVATIDGLYLSLRKKSYLSGNNHIKDVEDTEAKSSFGKHARDFVQVIEELNPSFPASSLERLKMLMSL